MLFEGVRNDSGGRSEMGSSCMLAAALNMIKNQAAIVFWSNINKSYNEAIKVPPLFQQGHRINYQRKLH